MKHNNNKPALKEPKRGPNVRKWRNFRELKQEQFASMLKLSPAAVSNIENGKTFINYIMEAKIAAILKLEVKELEISPQDYMLLLQQKLAMLQPDKI